jgi:hypothetical protein
MERRQVLHVLGAGIAAATNAWSTPGSLRFLTRDEYDTVDRLCELLLPADESGPGAHDAGVAGYVDLILHYSDAGLREQWRSGLVAVNSLANRTYGAALAACTADQQRAVMEKLAAGETHPETSAEKFFVVLKATAIQGFSLSGPGRRALGYRGDTAVHTFRGCTHPEHQA